MAKTLVRKKASYPIPAKRLCLKRKEGQSHFIKLSFQHMYVLPSLTPIFKVFPYLTLGKQVKRKWLELAKK